MTTVNVTINGDAQQASEEIRALIARAVRAATLSGAEKLDRDIQDAEAEWQWAGMEAMRLSIEAVVEGDYADGARLSADALMCFARSAGIRPALAVSSFFLRMAGVDPWQAR